VRNHSAKRATSRRELRLQPTPACPVSVKANCPVLGTVRRPSRPTNCPGLRSGLAGRVPRCPSASNTSVATIKQPVRPRRPALESGSFPNGVVASLPGCERSFAHLLQHEPSALATGATSRKERSAALSLARGLHPWTSRISARQTQAPHEGHREPGPNHPDRPPSAPVRNRHRGANPCPPQQGLPALYLATISPRLKHWRRARPPKLRAHNGDSPFAAAPRR